MSTHFSGTSSETTSLDTFIKLMRAAESVNGSIRRHLDNNELTTSQFGILEALFHIGPLTQIELGQKILKSGGNITRVIDNLEKRELVQRQAHPDDRRCHRVALTATGQKLISAIFPSHVKVIENVMTVLSQKEQKQLQALLKKLGTSAAATHS